MIGTRRFPLPALAAIVLVAATATPAAATLDLRWQQQVPAPSVAPVGWVGLQVDFIARGASRAHSGEYRVVISAVVQDSPAFEAGVQPGDTLLTINGTPASPHSFDQLRSGLRAGDDIRFALRRGSEVRDVEIVARPRPVFVFGPAPADIEMRIDSMSNAILRNADSLRRRAESVRRGTVVRGRNVTISTFGFDADSFVTVLEVSEGGAVSVSGGGVTVGTTDGVTTINAWGSWVGQTPQPQAFESFVVYTPGTDSIRVTIEALREDLDRARRAEIRRRQELAGRAADQRLVDWDDAVLVELREKQGTLRARLTSEESALRAVSRAALVVAARSRQAPPPPAAPVAHAVAERPPEPDEPRATITPYIVGQSYLAGARVTSMNPDLASYFGVSEGILVTEVTPGTPASDTGLRSGDVVVSVDGRPVTKVSELRALLADRWNGATLEVVRQGNEMAIVLR